MGGAGWGWVHGLVIPTNKLHLQDLVYSIRHPSTSCTDGYLGETAWRVADHSGRDTKSH